MASKSIDATLTKMLAGSEVMFGELRNVCIHYFGAYRIKGSHHIFSTPWIGDPRINIQESGGKAKRYQVRQVVAAINKLADIKLAQSKPKK